MDTKFVHSYCDYWYLHSQHVESGIPWGSHCLSEYQVYTSLLHTNLLESSGVTIRDHKILKTTTFPCIIWKERLRERTEAFFMWTLLIGIPTVSWTLSWTLADVVNNTISAPEAQYTNLSLLARVATDNHTPLDFF